MARSKQTVEQLQQRLAAGEWLQLLEVSRLLGRPRSTVDRWIKNGKTPTDLQLRSRQNPTSGYREVDPADVRAIRDAIRRAEDPPG